MGDLVSVQEFLNHFVIIEADVLQESVADPPDIGGVQVPDEYLGEQDEAVAHVGHDVLTGEDTVYERTFERGVEDFTYACGTGTGSVVTVLTLQGKVSGHSVKVRMTGGELVIDAEREGSRITDLYLTGPTNIVCKGEVTDEDLRLAK